ncbi:MAG: tetratricopeptide repeat protein [Candidatus Altimarinota bacterium]
MKHGLGFLIALIVIIKAFEIAPFTKAPLEELSDLPLQASLLQSNSPQTPSKPETKTLLNLLEIAIDQERNFRQGLDLMEQAASTEENMKLIELYEAKILARTLDFETAQKLLEGLNDEEIILVKAAVLIASGDRNKAGAYLHDLSNHHLNPEVRLTAVSLLNIYREFDRHRDADESYLWTLFAQKLGDLGELEISLYLADKAAQKNPEYRDAWIIKGYDELSLKRPDEAELSLLTAYRLDPGNPHVQYLLGLTYFDLGKPELSTQYLLYSRSEEPQYESIILEKLAENAIKTQDFALAAHYFEELIRLHPHHFPSLSRLVWLQVEHLNQFEKAVENAQILVSASPTEENYKLLSWALATAGDTEAAAEVLKKME